MKSYNTYMTKTTLTGSPISKQIRMVLLGKGHSICVYIPTIFTVYIISSLNYKQKVVFKGLTPYQADRIMLEAHSPTLHKTMY